jgi:dihydrofolate synthase / folylpolyglutamate synthase
MRARSLPQWLRWQESLHPRWIDLDLDRVRQVAMRLGGVLPAVPGAPVFTVAGTNGKGSTVALLEAVLRRAGRRTGVYTSPHLVRYTERMRIDGVPVDEATLISAFERIEAARGELPLTFFEFGTLAAFDVFRAAGCDAWVLEVGMGGRLDAVNIVDADFALITTIDLDHQEFLGETIEQIAAEKAGIMRRDRPAFYGDWPAPAAIVEAAGTLGAPLHRLGMQFDFTPSQPTWSWRGRALSLEGLRWPAGATGAQLRNISLALAALESFDPALIGDVATVNDIVTTLRPPGRFQIVEREHQWILDVAHNPQAAATLRAQLQTLPAAPDSSAVLGLLGDKNLAGFVAALEGSVSRWITCGVDDPRARSGESLAAQLRDLGVPEVHTAGDVDAALMLAQSCTAPRGRIVVCGSFRVVGPALQWLGLY